MQSWIQSPCKTHDLPLLATPVRIELTPLSSKPSPLPLSVRGSYILIGALARNRTAFSDLQDPTSSINVSRALFGAVTWNRTKFCDLRGRCIATYALTAFCLVPITGVEPAWGFPRYVLSVVCIPFHQIGIMFGAVDEDRTRLRQIDSLLRSQSATTAMFGAFRRFVILPYEVGRTPMHLVGEVGVEPTMTANFKSARYTNSLLTHRSWCLLEDLNPHLKD